MPLWIRYDGLTAGGHRGSDVIINASPPVSTDVRFDRTDLLGADGQMAGRDLISKRVWDFTLYTNQSSEDEAVSLAQAWEQAWHDPEVRSGAKRVPLEYSRDNATWYRVYGRPTLFTGPELNVLTRQGAGQIDLQFEQLDALHYSVPQSETLNAIASAFQGGWVAPFIFPLTASGTSVPSSVAVDNGGSEPAPIKVTFYGPSINPRAWAGPLEVQYRGALAHDEWVSIDGLTHEVLLGGAGRSEPINVPGRLSPHTLISELSVPVGRTDWWYEAVDESAQSRAVFTWWDAHRTMQ